MFDDNDRNIPERVAPKNPLPDNAKTSATGDAGRDGYTIIGQQRTDDGRQTRQDRGRTSSVVCPEPVPAKAGVVRLQHPIRRRAQSATDRQKG